MKVLIVDDEAYAVNALTNRIDWNGFGFGTPFSARSMAQAQSVFLNEKIDLLLCDIEMPPTNGFALLRWAQERFSGVVCIFLSAHAEFEYAFSLPATTNTLISGRPCSWEAAIIFSNRWIMTS